MSFLLQQGPFAEVLELACGTGIWTRELLQISQNITALDASQEVLELNREKVQSEKVTYQQQDLFAWQPDRQYDLVFFSFWLSHVPPEFLDEFLAKVYRATKTGGHILIVDSLEEPTSTSTDWPLQENEQVYRTRKLNNGQIYKIVKVFYKPEELKARLAAQGFEAVVKATPNYFLYAIGSKQPNFENS
jgi:demethylmenaquinone methyltransferase/2-methoxy-6-polyprenyl-1,4-benzoquinol methylase